MPTVNIRKKLFEERMGQQYSEQELETLCFEFGIEVEFYKELENGVEIEFNSFEVASNRVDLLCVEGIVRSLKIFSLGVKPELYKGIKLDDNNHKIIVKRNTKQIRPYVVGAILRNIKMNQEVYDSFIDLQDKLHQNICRRRKLVSIGTHDLDAIEGPFIYDARSPQEIKFIPLNKTEEMDGNRLIEVYSNDIKLKPFLQYIKDSQVFPVFYDNKERVMSLPPIINSEYSKIKLSTKNIFIEATAIDYNKAHQVLAQLVANFTVHCENQYSYEEVIVHYEEDKKDDISPQLTIRNMDCQLLYLKKLAGIEVSSDKACELLNRMGLVAETKENGVIGVKIDVNRSDIMHPCDVAEDLAIAYNYNLVEEVATPSPTIGSQQFINKVSDLLRQELAFAGYKECLNFALCSKEEISTLINQPLSHNISISNPKTLDFQTARTTLIPGLMKTLHGNKNNKLPLDLFELSDVVLKDTNKEQGAKNQRRLCALHSNQNSSGFELIHGLLDYIMLKLNVSYDQTHGYLIAQSTNPTFLQGRQAQIFYQSQPIGFMGVIHPNVLNNFDWPYPVSLIEIQVEPLIQNLQ